MRRDRQAELHFYEWRMAAWSMSETRDRLDATGRGIYRELLDCCYAQGVIPDDPKWICRRCACTPEQLAEVWPIIECKFPRCSESHRHNVHADIVRKEYTAYVDKQRANRKGKSNAESNLHNGGTTTDERSFNGGGIANEPNGNGNGNGNGNDTATTEEPTAPKTGADMLSFDPGGLVRPHVHPRRGKRSTPDIERDLGERLLWWERCWEIYPEKNGKREAMDTFERTVTTRELAETIYRGIQRYAAWLKADPTAKPKYMQGWLNGERWHDELIPRAISPHPPRTASLADRTMALVQRRISNGESPL